MLQEKKLTTYLKINPNPKSQNIEFLKYQSAS